MEKVLITIEATIAKPVETVWQSWTQPEHIMNWCFATPEWHAPAATNDLQVGGHFSTTMAAKDGSMSFDFGGVYTEVVEHAKIAYVMDDERTVSIQFEVVEAGVKVVEQFEAEQTNPPEMQQAGWQSILNQFKAYTESL